MAMKRDSAAELGDRMLHLLSSQRSLGGDAYPLTVRRLVELADPAASTSQIKKALGKRGFQSQAVVARKTDADSPIALAADAELLAGSGQLLEYLLRSLRTAANQAFSVSNLKAKVTSKLQKPLQAALERQLGQGALPATVGWLSINRSKKLFLMSDVHLGRVALPTQPPAQPQVQPVQFALAFADAFQQLDRKAGGHNFVSLVDLRQALPLPREVFDTSLRQLRLAGQYGLSAAEGRHGLRPEEQEAGIVEDGTLLLYVSRKMP